MNAKYVRIDIETTGLNPENCQVLEIDNGRRVIPNNAGLAS